MYRYIGGIASKMFMHLVISSYFVVLELKVTIHLFTAKTWDNIRASVEGKMGAEAVPSDIPEASVLSGCIVAAYVPLRQRA